jgi:hypothetical protein
MLIGVVQSELMDSTRAEPVPSRFIEVIDP